MRGYPSETSVRVRASTETISVVQDAHLHFASAECRHLHTGNQNTEIPRSRSRDSRKKVDQVTKCCQSILEKASQCSTFIMFYISKSSNTTLECCCCHCSFLSPAPPRVTRWPCLDKVPILNTQCAREVLPLFAHPHHGHP